MSSGQEWRFVPGPGTEDLTRGCFGAPPLNSASVSNVASCLLREGKYEQAVAEVPSEHQNNIRGTKKQVYPHNCSGLKLQDSLAGSTVQT